MSAALPRPYARTHRVEDLVKLVVSGEIRIPTFQRGLKWQADDVVELFQSINLGYPIGSLLFHRKAAPAQVLTMGPIKIHGPETATALWVVDGQQRIVSLAVSFSRPMPIASAAKDPWIVYFDAVAGEFHSPPKTEEVPDTWVPLTVMLDASILSEWVFQWVHGRDSALRKAVFNAGSRLREYTIPSYTVDTDDPAVLKEIFLRVNKFGRRLEWTEVHDALFGHVDTSEPSTLGELADALEPVGMGRPHEQDQLLRCLIAYEGYDVTADFSGPEPEFLAGTAAAALPTLRRVLAFLQAEARIPHLRLLPWSAPLPILTRFFRFHPSPNARSRELLTRWVWRSIVAARLYDERTFVRRGVRDIEENDEEASVQKLLSFLPKQAPPHFQLPEQFDARSGESRIALLGLCSLGPRDLQTGQLLDVGDLIEASSIDAFRHVVGAGPSAASSPANRAILPGRGLARAELLNLVTPALFAPPAEPILRSHAISALGLAALQSGDHEAFLLDRAQLLEQRCNEHTQAMADWGGNDRPSLDYIIDHSLEPSDPP